MTVPALRHATRLIAELGNGKIARGIVDVYPGKQKPATVTLTVEKTSRVLGIKVGAKQITEALTALGFECKAEGGEIKATAPYWRSDIRLAEDLIEEVARIIGYDKIPTTLFRDPIPSHTPDVSLETVRAIRHYLTGYGFQEIMTYTMSGLQSLSNLLPEPAPPEPMPVRVLNPMTADQEYMRPTLRANILSTLASNRRHEEEGIRLFELGKIFIPSEKGLPVEPEVLCGMMSGSRVVKSWLGGDGAYDFYDIKGAVESLLEHLGITAEFEKSDDGSLHPARQAAIVIKDKGMKVKLGVIGELHPRVADAFEISETVGLFEININSLLPFTTEVKTYEPVSRFPGIYRDLALVVDADLSHRMIVDIIKGFSLVSEVRLFDVYSGKQVAPGKKSLAYRLVYQSPTHTLTDEEVNKVQEQILKKLTDKLGAMLRG
jgi:phenylalanyl-tRNA synthetase beta chain